MVGDPLVEAKSSPVLSILIYVEFGVAFPFNGGELIYVSWNTADRSCGMY